MCALGALEDGACSVHSQHLCPTLALLRVSIEVDLAHLGAARAAVRDELFLGWFRAASIPLLIIAGPPSGRVRPCQGLVSKGDST